MADPAPWIIKPPTPDTAPDGTKFNAVKKLPPEPSDIQIEWLDQAILSSHVRFWFPDMTGWRVTYDKNGLKGCQQTWIAPWKTKVYADSSLNRPSKLASVAYLPQVIRQMLSWNRERYSHYNKFWDMDLIRSANPAVTASHGQNLYRDMVITDVELIPRPDLMDTDSEKQALRNVQTSMGIMSYDGDDTRWDAVSSDLMTFARLVQQQLRLGDSNGVEIESFKKFQQVFPRIRSQFWQLNITWQPDPYMNRLGIRYAKVEMQPSLRMESIKNATMGVTPTKFNGQPEFDLVDPNRIIIRKNIDPDPATPGVPQSASQDYYGKAEWIQSVSTGFPVREPQISVKVTYPWVSLENLVKYGPIGNVPQLDITTNNGKPSLAIVSPYKIPDGLYLGCVNKSSFLGYSRGRVLYNSCEIAESVSPITGKIGYEVTHEFLVHPTMEWNQTRYTGDYEPIAAENGEPWAFYNKKINPNSAELLPGENTPVTSPFKTGYMVQLHPVSGGQKIVRVALGAPDNFQAVYPYSYKDMNDLLYYGLVGSTKKLDGVTDWFNPMTTEEG